MENQTLLPITQGNATISGLNWTSTSSTSTTISSGEAIIAQFRIPKYVLYGLILTLSIVGNAAVVHIIRTRQRIHKTSYILLVLNLAICDTLTPTVSIPIDWVFEEFDRKWTLGPVFCKLLWPLQTMFSTSSALILTMICYDRYRAVVHPFKARRVTKTHIKHCIFAIHFASCMLTIPYAIVLRLKGDDCQEHWPSPVSSYRKTYTLVLFLAQYGIPLILMVSLHGLALRTLCEQTNNMKLLGSRERTQSESSALHLHSRKKEQNIRVTKMFVMVVMVFAMSMFPNQILWLWVDFGNGENNEYFAIISAVCRLFTYSNSVLNPIIYGFYSREFRSGKTKLKKTTCTQSTESNPVTLSSGFNYLIAKTAGHRLETANGLSSRREAPYWSDITNKRIIHSKESSGSGGKRNSSEASIKNSSVALKSHCQQNAPILNAIKPSESTTERIGVHRSRAAKPYTLKNNEMEKYEHVVFSIPEHVLRHCHDIRESRC